VNTAHRKLQTDTSLQFVPSIMQAHDNNITSCMNSVLKVGLLEKKAVFWTTVLHC